MPNAPQSCFVTARDGLRLHYLDFSHDGGRAAVVCLPGLSRSAEDFRPLALALQSEGRRVLALDYRGRGLSDWDADWRHYDLDVEEDDIFMVLADAGVTRAVFIGTSRGGLHMMRIAASKPGVILAGVMNDVGPEIDHAGLLRIKRYVGKLPPIHSMADATALMKMTAGRHFSGVSPEEWETYARQTFVEKEYVSYAKHQGFHETSSTSTGVSLKFFIPLNMEETSPSFSMT
ncbi:MAG: alpha/beta hydrolase, partial [Methylocystis sp.]|nr:alpha/beta hydrolase [Methylocystis sp.]